MRIFAYDSFVSMEMDFLWNIDRIKIVGFTILVLVSSVSLSLCLCRFIFYSSISLYHNERYFIEIGHILMTLYIFINILPTFLVFSHRFKHLFSMRWYIGLQTIWNLNPYTLFLLFACGFYRDCI